MVKDAWKNRRVLVTAGPTHEPIDAVRYIGNRSSGRMGVAIAQSLAKAGASVRLLLGPGVRAPDDPGFKSNLEVEHFTTAASLGALLERHQTWADMIVMAAAVADFSPRVSAEDLRGKWKRERSQATSQGTLGAGSGSITLELIPTPDLLAACAARRSAAMTTWGGAQRLVGFALEPRERLLSSALAKLERKSLDAIVANPLETMDSQDVEATLILRGGQATVAGCQSKNSFADWLVDQLRRIL